jgi:threonine dehydrogenase-like Zn-dependent dehydrogenase
LYQVKAFGPQDLRVVEVSEPIPGEGEVLIDVRACGICGSDKWFWHVSEPNDYVAGHEAAGIVVAVGANVDTLRAGDRVTVNNVRGCGVCDACRQGAFVRCPNGVTHMGFGFSEKIIAPVRNCLVLEDGISYEAGSLIFDNWGTPYSALRRTNMKPGDKVVVFGCGPIGLAAVTLARIRGASVIAVDPVESRLDAAARQGATLTISPDERTVQAILEEAGAEGVDYVLECSGKAASYETAFAVLRIGGTLVSIGEGAIYEINSSRLIHKHLTMFGSLYSTMQDGREVQELMVRGEIDPLAFVTDRFSLFELPEKFGRVITGGEGLLKSIVVTE